MSQRKAVRFIMSLRVYNIGGQRATFNKEGFKYLVKEKCRREKITKAKAEQQLADLLGLSSDTVHKWNSTGGGPIDIQTVEDLAKTLGLVNSDPLLNFITGGDSVERLSDRQKSAAKQIYDVCICFLDEFKRTNGFNDYWFEFKDKGARNPENAICDYVEKWIAKIQLVLNQEYFDLHNSGIYDELCDFVNEDLYNTFEGKLGYGYRFEAQVDGNPTTDDDYNCAMIHLNSIIERYV